MRRFTLFSLAFVAILAAAGGTPAAESLEKQVLGSILDYPAGPAPIEELRKGGPASLDELFRIRTGVEERLKAAIAAPATEESPYHIRYAERQLARLDNIIDQVGMQRYCTRSRLYWYTDFEQAKAEATKSGKPILSLRMLGNLNEDFSCANSRFFRTTLYANEEISKFLRENYILHWKSVRPVPRVTIDFGDGRKLERTITGNSIHYVLTPDGEVVEALPGLYGPQAFLAKLSEALPVARNVAALSPEERQPLLAEYHAREFLVISDRFAADLARVQAGTLATAAVAPQPAAARKAGPPAANVAAAVARPKVEIERPLLAAALPLSSDPTKLDDDNVWQAIAALHAGEARIDNSSRELIRSENPNAAIAGRLAITKRRVEDPLVRLVQTLESSIALDSMKNEYRFHRQIHEWLMAGNYRPDVDTLNERVYAELFLTPRSDPWLGLAPAEVYTALPNAGVVQGR
ncbi:MAG TPA: hypothetical protein VFB80_09850 [Pirellulaceae bacterium]|nr:hypothetical protein [Pirellulaceae bacterium]